MAKKRQQPEGRSTACAEPPAKVRRRAKWGGVGEKPRQRGQAIPQAVVKALIPIVPGAAERRTDAAEGGATVQLEGVCWQVVADGHLLITEWIRDPTNHPSLRLLTASASAAPSTCLCDSGRACLCDSATVKRWASVEPFVVHQMKVSYRRAFRLTINEYGQLGDSAPRALSVSQWAVWMRARRQTLAGMSVAPLGHDTSRTDHLKRYGVRISI
jgi:hypothetical protein